MNIDAFIKQFADQFDDIPTHDFNADTKFKENKEWSSMTALCVIALVDDSYAVRLTDQDIKQSSTIKDIFDIVSSKVNS